MVKLLTIRSYPSSEHLFMCKQDLGIGCGLKSRMKKVGNVVKKGFKGLQKAEDLINNLHKKAITTLGTNQKIRDIIEAVPMGDTINGITKLASDVVKTTDKMNEKIKKKENPFDKEIKDDLKKVVNDAKNDPGIKKLYEESKNLIKDLFGKVNDSDLPQKEKEEIKDKAETINLDLIKDAKNKSVAGKLAKSLPYAMFVNKSSKRPEIPKKYVDKFKIAKRSFNNEGGRLFLSGSAGRLGLGLTLKTPTPEGGEIAKVVKKSNDSHKKINDDLGIKKKVSKKEIYDILFN